jgi:hypothetical protein
VLAACQSDIDALVSHPVRALSTPVATPQARPGRVIVELPDHYLIDRGDKAARHRLLRLADLRIVVTSAARYGDAALWEILLNPDDAIRAHGLIVNRVAPRDADVIRTDLTERLDALPYDNPRAVIVQELPSHEASLADDDGAHLERWMADLAAPTADGSGEVSGDWWRATVEAIREDLAFLAETVRRGTDEAVALSAALDEAWRSIKAAEAALLAARTSVPLVAAAPGDEPETVEEPAHEAAEHDAAPEANAEPSGSEPEASELGEPGATEPGSDESKAEDPEPEHLDADELEPEHLSTDEPESDEPERPGTDESEVEEPEPREPEPQEHEPREPEPQEPEPREPESEELGLSPAPGPRPADPRIAGLPAHLELTGVWARVRGATLGQVVDDPEWTDSADWRRGATQAGIDVTASVTWCAEQLIDLVRLHTRDRVRAAWDSASNTGGEELTEAVDRAARDGQMRGWQGTRTTADQVAVWLGDIDAAVVEHGDTPALEGLARGMGRPGLGALAGAAALDCPDAGKFLTSVGGEAAASIVDAAYDALSGSLLMAARDVVDGARAMLEQTVLGDDLGPLLAGHMAHFAEEDE